MNEKKLYEKVFETYGKEAQIIKAIEEMAELSVSLCGHKLNKENAAAEVQNELADCIIMLDQMDMIFGIAGLVGEREPDPHFEYKPKTLIGDILGAMGEVQLWLSEYEGTDNENKILREHFKRLRINFEKLAEQFGVEEVANCRAFKLRRLELRLNLGAA